MAVFGPIGNDASSLVTQGFEKSQGYGDSAYDKAIKFLTDIKDIARGLKGIDNIDEELEELTSEVSDFEKPEKPTVADINPAFPHINTHLNLAPVSPFEVPEPTPFSVDAPNLTDFDAPAKFDRSAPTAPDLPVREYPDAPDETIPAPPTLRELSLPDDPELIEVSFDMAVPEQLDDVPDAVFIFSEPDYVSSLLDRINGTLLGYLEGFATGLPPEIEQQIWDRARRRTSIATARLKAQLNRGWSASGWDMPGGDLQNKHYEAEQEAVNNDIAESRAIAIAQAELQQRNIQFALTTATQLEALLLQHHDNVQQRSLEAARYAVQSAVELHGLKVAEFNGNVELYKAVSQVVRDRMANELAKLEQFKAKLEGQKLIGELNQQDLSNYREQINAVVALFGLYDSKLRAVKMQLEGDALVLSRFDAEIKSFDSEIKAKSLEYDGFKAEQDAENNKTERFKALTAAHAEEMNAFRTLVDARKNKQDAELEINQRIPLEVFKQRSESIRTLVQAESERLRALSDTAKTHAQIYETETRAESARIDAEVNVQENELKHLIAKADIKIESLKANISSELSKLGLLSDAARAGSQVAAQLAAASLSAVNLSASIGNSMSTSESKSISDSFSESHVYTHSDD